MLNLHTNGKKPKTNKKKTVNVWVYSNNPHPPTNQLNIDKNHFILLRWIRIVGVQNNMQMGEWTEGREQLD